MRGRIALTIACLLAGSALVRAQDMGDRAICQQAGWFGHNLELCLRDSLEKRRRVAAGSTDVDDLGIPVADGPNASYPYPSPQSSSPQTSAPALAQGCPYESEPPKISRILCPLVAEPWRVRWAIEHADPGDLNECRDFCYNPTYFTGTDKTLCVAWCVQDHAENTVERQARLGESPTVYVPLNRHGGIFTVSVVINGAMSLDFGVDSGAADVNIPQDVYSDLKRMGAVSDSDTTGYQTYKLADGRQQQALTFRIRSLKIGDTIIENVTASVGGSPLLGQSFLKRFKSWSIDNGQERLVLVTK
jgi:clan AA aspartic protease (TIGR02281 family)